MRAGDYMNSGSAQYKDILTLAIGAATDAGELVLREAGREHVVIQKHSGSDYVTRVDLDVERFIAKRIREQRPDDAILGEEGTQIDGDGLRWIIDPIDGTSNFIRGLPGFVISIAVQDGPENVVGVVFDPVHQELFAARSGCVAECNGSPVEASKTTNLTDAIIGTGFAPDAGVRRAQARALAELLPRVGELRSFGVCAHDCCHVAAARLDAYYESGLAAWDYAAGIVIARQAGAEVRLSQGVGMRAAMLIVSAPGVVAELERALKLPIA